MARRKSLAIKLDNETLKPVIETMNQYGLASHRLVREAVVYVGMAPIEEHQITYQINKLLQLHVIELLQSNPVYTQSSGRSEKIYRFTPLGAATLNEMGYSDAKPLMLDGPLDVSHRCCMALVAARASHSGTVTLEKVIPYAPGHNVRTDVHVKLDDGQIRLVEIEQELASNNLQRAVEKIRNYAALFATHPANTSTEVLIVFNLPANQLPRTLKVWQRALRDARVSETIAFYYTILSNFIDDGYVSGWEGIFEHLQPLQKKNGPDDKDDPSIPNVSNDFCSAAEYFEHGNEICDAWEIIQESNARDRLNSINDLAARFYELDFGERGQTKNYGLTPVNSLGSLKAFLHDPRHRTLLQIMKQAVERYRRATGVTQQMVLAIDLASTFLDAFGVSASWMEVSFATPMTGTYERSHFHIGARGSDALEWLLGAFIFNPRELGLVDEKTKR